MHSLSLSCTLTGDDKEVVTLKRWLNVCMCFGKAINPHMVCFTTCMLFFSQRAALICVTTQRTQELSDIHSSMQVTDRPQTAACLTAGQGVHTHLHPQVCTLYWRKVKYWLHSTKQTSEKLLWWLTHSAAATPILKLTEGWDTVSPAVSQTWSLFALWTGGILITIFTFTWLAWLHPKYSKCTSTLLRFTN